MGDDVPRISCIIPVYNTERYLRQCLDSIADQTFSDYEVLMVNDGSTDSSKAICAEYERKDSRFKLIDKMNGGVSSARNVGLEHATSDYVYFVDSDDWISSDCFETLYDTIKNRSGAICACGLIKHIGTQTYPLSSGKDGLEQFSTRNSTIYPFLFYPAAGRLGCMLFPRRNLVANGILFDERLHFGEDALFNLQAINSCELVMSLNKCLYFYRVYNESTANKVYSDINSSELAYLFEKESEVLAGYALSGLQVKSLKTYLYYNNFVSLVTNACAIPDSTKMLTKIKAVNDEFAPIYHPSLRELLSYLGCVSFKAKVNLVLVKLRLYRLIRFIRIRNRSS